MRVFVNRSTGPLGRPNDLTAVGHHVLGLPRRS